MTTTVRQGVPVRVVGIFLLVSFGVALMLDAVAALTGGLGTPHAKGLLALRMFTPWPHGWPAVSSPESRGFRRSGFPARLIGGDG